MSTKEKLIEEIRAVPIAGKTYEEYVEALADKLLENVIVPPCKVGQTVYVVQLCEIYECRVNEICISAGNNNVVVLDRFVKGFLIRRYGGEYFNAFGETVFLDRASAEAKLKAKLKGADNEQRKAD
jgi:hypothetical protein